MKREPLPGDRDPSLWSAYIPAMLLDVPLYALQLLPSGQWLIRTLCDDPLLPAVIVIDEARIERGLKNRQTNG